MQQNREQPHDLDGFPDVFIANDKTENFLFHNEKNGTFKEIALPAGVAYGQNGESNIAVGKVLKARGRNGLWLANKIQVRKYDDFMRRLEISLKRLQVDHVDLLHLHALMGPEDLEAVSAKDGAYAAAVLFGLMEE